MELTDPRDGTHAVAQHWAVGCHFQKSVDVDVDFIHYIYPGGFI
jgi:hypothetical protein